MLELGWNDSKIEADFTINNFLSDKVINQFEHKNELIYLLNKNRLKISPLSFVVDELNLSYVLNHIEQQGMDNPWILKPALLNNGNGIVLMKDPKEINSFFSSVSRYGGKYVLQQYLDNPMLLNKRKFSIRVFVILTSSGQGYIYKDGYLNLCYQPYLNDDFRERAAHLTNEYLNKDGTLNNNQIITTEWNNYIDYAPFIVKQCQSLFQPWINQNHTNLAQYAVLGVDFMLTSDHNLWLLEVNHGPCFPTNNDHPLFEKLYQPFWQSFVDDIIHQKISESRTKLSMKNYFKIVN